MRDAAAKGKGAVSLDGRLIDAASIRMAETLLAKLDQIEAKDDEHEGDRANARRQKLSRREERQAEVEGSDEPEPDPEPAQAGS